MSKTSSGSSLEMADLRDEQQMLARLTADLDCSQQKFFQGEYGRHRRSPIGALLLCLLLGDFGAHEFYFGRLMSGLIRLFFSWTLVPWLIALCEAPHVPAYARQYNAKLAQSIVDMLHEVRAHVRALDPSPAPAAVGAATVIAAPAVAPIVLRPTDEHLIRAASAEAPEDTASDPSNAPYAALRGGASLAAFSALAAEAVGYRQASESNAQAAAPTPDGIPDAIPVAPTSAAPDASADDRSAPQPEDTAQDATQDTPATNGQATPVEDAAAVAAVPVFAYSLGAARHPPVRYGPPLADSAETDSPDAAQQAPAKPQRMRRIVVRKVALVDGEIAAEAIATREVAVDDPTSPLSLEERIRLATDDARDEALRLLAERVPDDVRADAAQQFGEYA